MHKVVFDALADPVLRRDESFRKFLARGGLNDDELSTALAKLDQERANGGRSESIKHYPDTPPDALALELAVPVNFESWDDSLPSYLKVVSRLGQGRTLDPGDWQKAGIEATGDLVIYFSEPIAATLNAARLAGAGPGRQRYSRHPEDRRQRNWSTMLSAKISNNERQQPALAAQRCRPKTRS